MTLTLNAPAKVNLYLRIVGRRPDGYHLLESLFQTVSLFDTLTFDLDTFDSLTCSDRTIPTDQRNLVCKALQLFRLRTGFDTPVHIHLEKRIPSEAGLGGGSSDAATTLKALNTLSGLGLPATQLAEWSKSLGADVPFFFSSGCAVCRGIGDDIEECAPEGPADLTLVTPPFGMPTARVFGALRPPYGKAGPEGNDLEQVALELRPELRELKTRLLQSGFDRVQMTGSGSTFYCLGRGEAQLPPDHKVFRVNKVYAS